MDIAEYHQADPEGDALRITFTEQQASDFAKGIAGDFNPIHDVGSRRFCVPGDLLFAVLIHRYGIHARTHVQFAGMLDAGVALSFPVSMTQPLLVNDQRGRTVLTFMASEPVGHDAQFGASISEQYVQFSGRTFPDILVGLMRERGVMINPDRPLVIYRDMALELERFEGSDVSLQLADAELDVDGKKGIARLRFTVLDGDRCIGQGEKNLVLSGLRPFEEDAMTALIEDYNLRKINYRENRRHVM